MNYKLVIIILITMTMITNVIIGAVGNKTVSATFDDNDADVPIWHVGDSWTYDVTINGGIEEVAYLNNVEMKDLTFVVEEVQTDVYRLSMASDLTGSVEVQLTDTLSLVGSLQEAEMSGTAYADKSTLAVEQIGPLHADGYVKPAILPRVAFEVNGDVSIFYGVVSSLDFPINVGETWMVDEIEMDFDLSAVALGQTIPIVMATYVEQHGLECTGWDTIQAGGITYDALKISNDPTQPLGNQLDIWYSPQIANIVKVVGRNIPLSWGGWGYYDIDLILKSTTYNNPPDAPETPSGETDGRAGVEYSYCTSGGIDPDGHKVKYGFDWTGDGTVDDWTNLVNSGEQACATHSYSSAGTYTIKAKTQDEKGAESDEWSPGLTVTMIPNDPPDKPDTPSGETNGMVGVSYDYATNAVTDPDGDSVEYKFNWNDGSDSGWLSSPSASHSWNTKGTYAVTVIAQDEYGAKSESDPLLVTINNNAPDKPSMPEGPPSGRKKTTYTYSTSTNDPDGHQIKYCFDWGDGATTWTDFVNSGDTTSASHEWAQGSYEIKVKAQDEYGEESEWSDPLPISMPRNRNFIRLIEFMDLILEKFPSLEQILGFF